MKIPTWYLSMVNGGDFILKIRRQFGSFFRKITPRGMANKLFAIISVIGIFLAFSLAYIATSISGSFLYEAAKNLLDNQAKQTVNIFDQYMDILKNTVMTTSREGSVQSLIKGNYDAYGSYLVHHNSYAYLKNIHEFYDWINIYVIAKKDNYIMSSNPEDVTSDFRKKGVEKMEWYGRMENALEGTFIISDFIPPVSSDKEHFAYALKVRDVYDWETDGYIIAAIDKAILDDLLRGTSFEENGFLLVLNDKGEIAYASDSSVFKSDFSLEELRSELRSSGNYAFGSSRDYYYSSWKSKASGWSFIAFADKNHAKAQILNLQLLVIVIAALAVMLLIVAARFISNAYTRPVKTLIKFIHEVEEKEFAGQIDLKLEDEMGDLINSFNALIASVRQNQVLRKRAEIDALQKQINPHFLFNTFQSIKALAQQKDTRSVVEMIEKLSDIFHYNMNRSNSSMTEIRNEIDHIRNYLDIQRVRFGNRMQVFYDIDERVLSYWTMRFILQPIVENSISHSMELMDGGYRLDIRGGFDGEDILFIIRDNGVGIPEEKLEKLKEYIYDNEGTISNDDFGIGLKNIQERLYLLYGEGYGLTIRSVPDEYTEIRIRIAKMTKEEAIKR
jgi:sensor histidine kinase YesM